MVCTARPVRLGINIPASAMASYTSVLFSGMFDASTPSAAFNISTKRGHTHATKCCDTQNGFRSVLGGKSRNDKAIPLMARAWIFGFLARLMSLASTAFATGACSMLLPVDWESHSMMQRPMLPPKSIALPPIDASHSSRIRGFCHNHSIAALGTRLKINGNAATSWSPC